MMKANRIRIMKRMTWRIHSCKYPNQSQRKRRIEM